MKDKTQSWTNKIEVPLISYSTAYLALSSTRMYNLKYALPLTTYTEKECDTLTIPLFRKYIPQDGNQSSPHSSITIQAHLMILITI